MENNIIKVMVKGTLRKAQLLEVVRREDGTVKTFDVRVLSPNPAAGVAVHYRGLKPERMRRSDLAQLDQQGREFRELILKAEGQG